MSNSPIIQVQQLTKTYRVGEVDVHALRGVDLEVAKGEFIAVVGTGVNGIADQIHQDLQHEMFVGSNLRHF